MMLCSLRQVEISKIISGGQTGADQAGLAAGKELGIKTGGYAPYNWMTDVGPKPELLKFYGLLPAPFDARTYPLRTRMNVRMSDGTVLFGKLTSPGTKLTINCCKKMGRHYIENPTPEDLRQWIIENDIRVLNVAGNRERSNPGIFERTKKILLSALI